MFVCVYVCVCVLCVSVETEACAGSSNFLPVKTRGSFLHISGQFDSHAAEGFSSARCSWGSLTEEEPNTAVVHSPHTSRD